MTASPPGLGTWLTPVSNALAQTGRAGGYLIVFETYRPDAVKMMAHALQLSFLDFRALHMAPLGSKAAQLPLSRIQEVIVAEITAGAGAAPHGDQVAATQTRDEEPETVCNGLVLHNVEALLATRAEAERRAWLSAFLAHPYSRPVLVPLSIFSAEAPAKPERVIVIDPVLLPPEKLLLRLASQ